MLLGPGPMTSDDTRASSFIIVGRGQGHSLYQMKQTGVCSIPEVDDRYQTLTLLGFPICVNAVVAHTSR